MDQLELLLEQLRRIDGLVEKSRGSFYCKGRAVLHFHEDPTGLYADVRLSGDEFDRLKVDAPEAQDALIQKIESALPYRI